MDRKIYKNTAYFVFIVTTIGLMLQGCNLDGNNSENDMEEYSILGTNRKINELKNGEAIDHIIAMLGDPLNVVTREQSRESAARLGIAAESPCDEQWSYAESDQEWYQLWITDGKLVHVNGPIDGPIPRDLP